MKKPNVRRLRAAACYFVQTDDGHWGFFVLQNDGLLMAHTSVGNYAFRWKGFGDGDFLEFVAGVATDGKYLLEKFARRELADLEESRRAYREKVLDLQRQGCITSGRARELYDEIAALTEEDAVDWPASVPEIVETDFWWWDLPARDYPPEARIFVERLFPLLGERLRQDLSRRGAVARGA